MSNNFNATAEELRREVERSLAKVGLLCRVFARGKDDISMQGKLNREPGKYAIGGKLIQDAVGLRVALYFTEDTEIVKDLLCGSYQLVQDSSTIDLPNTDQFAVTRYNLIFRIPPSLHSEVVRDIGTLPIDTTFEVQLRTVLSEGWHEVEHDLRYKTKSHWIDQDDLSRTLNGIVATLETADWSMKRIFDDLAYRHYKGGNWSAMLHTRLRMRVAPMLSEDLSKLLSANPLAAKEIFRIDRNKVIKAVAQARPRIPISLDNLVFIWNHLGPRITEVSKLSPVLIQEALDQLAISAGVEAVSS